MTAANGTNGTNGTAKGLQPKTQEAAEDILGKPLSLNYRPTVAVWNLFASAGNVVPWQSFLIDIEAMLCTPHVALPYSYLKAGIANCTFKIRASSSAVGEYAEKFYRRLWEKHLEQIQHGWDYGWGGYECVYRSKGGYLHLEALHDLHPLDVFALTWKGRYYGVSVHGVPDTRGNTLRLWGPGKWPAKGFWFSHNRRFHRWYGRSQLLGAWKSWRRLAWRDGAEEVVDGGFYRFAYQGPVIRYPPEDYKKSGGQIDYDAARNEARQMAEQAKAGFSTALPNTKDKDGDYKWSIEWPQQTLNLGPLLEYAQELQKEISFGIGVPPELIEAAETGSGWSGRKIPLLGFYTGQVRNARAIVAQTKWQILDPLLWWNFGPGAWAEVEPKIVLPEDLMGDDGKGGEGAGGPGGGNGGNGGGGLGALLGSGGAKPSPEVPQKPAPGNTITLDTDPDGGASFTLSVDETAELPSPDVADADVESVLDEVVGHFARLARKVRRELWAAIADEDPAATIGTARRVLDENLPEIVLALTEAQLAAVLRGMWRVAQRVKGEGVGAEAGESETAIAARPPDLPPWRPEGGEADEGEPASPTLRLIDHAVADLRSRRLLTRQQFDQLAGAARAQAFTVVGIESENVLGKVRNAVADAVEQGLTQTEFEKRVQEDTGTAPFLSPAHAETVFRTNVQAAYSAGQDRLLEHPVVDDLFPYREYYAIHDDRVRPDHAGLEKHGIGGGPIYRGDDPVWQLFKPPWDFNCRCGWRPLSIRDAADRGIEEAKEWLRTGAAPSRPAHVAMPPFRPPVGFDRRELATLATDAEGHEHGRDGKFVGKGQGTSAPARPAALPPAAKSRLHHLLARAAELPRAAKAAARRFAREKYAGLVRRFGRRGAKVVMGAVILLTPVPVPGSSFVPIALAESVRAMLRLLRKRRASTLAADLPPDTAELVAAAKEYLAAFYASHGEGAPALDHAEVRAAVEEAAGGEITLAFDPGKHPRGQPENAGEFAAKGKGGVREAKGKAPVAHPGSAHGSSVSVKPAKKRAFDGEPVATKTTLTKQETGRVGEAVAVAWLKRQGFKDARPMNSAKTNFPVDMLEDHRPTEVKAGLASNSRKAQQWRLTFSKESKAEKELYEKMTPNERRAWNAEKQKRIHARKQAVIKSLAKETGHKISPRTLTLIINPDTKTADVYEFDGLHDRIDWQSEMAKKAYRGSVTYEHAR